MNNTKTLHQIINELELYLAERGQTKNGISIYHYIFRVFENYSKSLDCECFFKTIMTECLKNHYGIESEKAELSRKQTYKKHVLRAYRLICDYASGNELPNRYTESTNVLQNSTFSEAVADFAESRLSDGKKPKSVTQYRRYSEQFLAFAEQNGITQFDDITGELINNFMLTYSGYSKHTIKYVLITLRAFLKFLYIKMYITRDLCFLVAKINVRSQTKIPSVWDKSSVIKLLNAVDRNNPSGKRDYAILLLVARLGIHVSDVNNLKFENINWQKNSLEFIQCKTGQFIRLPLLKDVRWALIDYIKNGRPQVEPSFVFLTHVAPFKKYASDNHLHATIKKYLALAGIQNHSIQKQGMHSLRHTLATGMLENQESIHMISSVLGHQSIDSTSVYLKTDIERLRECALIPSEVGI